MNWHLGYAIQLNPKKNQAKLAAFLKYIQVLDFSTEHANEAAQIRCDLTKKGTPIGPYDTLIAAHARGLDVILVTHNTREFGRVVGLKIEDWQEN
ncbi:MAG: PIN domain-containing protein [Anaerolineae bacterium]|nr:PIN domain-containing protein [Anaerolineae bacterium]